MRSATLITVTLSGLLFGAAPSTAWAQDTSVGVAAVGAIDLADRVQGDVAARFAGGAGLLVPVRIGLTPAASLRANVRFDYHSGRDVISWRIADGERTAEAVKAFLFSVGATVGPEVTIPVEGAVQPYLAGGIGGAWVGTYHSFTRCALMDPTVNDCENASNIDPYTLQPAFLTDAAVGVAAGDGPRFFAEGGFSAAFLTAQPLNKAEPVFSVRREAYAWNALRLAAGVAFPL